MGLGFGLPFALLTGQIHRQQHRPLEADPPESHDEEIILTGVAHRHLDYKGVSRGCLVLTKQHFRYREHQPENRIRDWCFELQELDRVEISKTLGWIPSGLQLTLPDGQRERFAVNDLRRWATTLNTARTAALQSQKREETAANNRGLRQKSTET